MEKSELGMNKSSTSSGRKNGFGGDSSKKVNKERWNMLKNVNQCFLFLSFCIVVVDYLGLDNLVIPAFFGLQY